MDLVRFFYVNIVGHYPENKDLVHQTACTIDYLLDCAFSESEIIQLLVVGAGTKETFSFEDIPDSAWNNSLIQRGSFYLHRELRLISPPPSIDKFGNEISYPLSIEMKIKYTLDDALNYFYYKSKTMPAMQERLRHISQLNTIYEKLKKFEWVEPLDMLLTLIDKATEENEGSIYEPFDIDKSNSLTFSVYDLLKRNKEEMKVGNRGQVIWRSECRNSSMNLAEF